METMEYMIDQSNNPDDPRPGAVGRLRVLWDEDYLYVRVVVEDEDVYTGAISDHAYDSVEFYVGPGSRGFNQWRISATGVWSGLNAEGRAGWSELTDGGYVVEVRLPKGGVTFELYIDYGDQFSPVIRYFHLLSAKFSSIDYESNRPTKYPYEPFHKNSELQDTESVFFIWMKY